MMQSRSLMGPFSMDEPRNPPPTRPLSTSPRLAGPVHHRGGTAHTLPKPDHSPWTRSPPPRPTPPQPTPSLPPATPPQPLRPAPAPLPRRIRPSRRHPASQHKIKQQPALETRQTRCRSRFRDTSRSSRATRPLPCAPRAPPRRLRRPPPSVALPASGCTLHPLPAAPPPLRPVLQGLGAQWPVGREALQRV